jgi:hypothetical protein
MLDVRDCRQRLLFQNITEVIDVPRKRCQSHHRIKELSPWSDAVRGLGLLHLLSGGVGRHSSFTLEFLCLLTFDDLFT